MGDISRLWLRWAEASPRKWLLLGGLVASAIMLAPTPTGLTQPGQRMLALLAFFVISFVTEALPVGASFPLVLAWIIFFQIVPPAEAVASFAHDSGLFMMGALMIARVLVSRNLHQRALTILLKIIPPKIPWLLAGLMGFGALASAIISDHTVAALLLPVGVTLVVTSGGIRRHPRLAKLLMLGIAYGCAIGGMGTPSGGSRNIIMMAYLQDIAGVQVTYRMWLTMALPITLILTPIVGVVLYMLYKPEKQDLSHIEDAVVGRMEKIGPMNHGDWATIAIFAVVMLGWVTIGDQYGIGVVAITGALIYVLAGLANWDEHYQHINWGIVLLYFAAISFGTALKTSGAALWLASRVMGTVQSALGLESGLRLALSSSAFMTLFSQTMSGGPAVALLGPVILESARLTGTSPVMVGVASALASSFAFMLIIGTPSNAIMYSSGYLEARDFVRAGFWTAIISIGVLMLVVAFWWPVLGVS